MMNVRIRCFVSVFVLELIIVLACLECSLQGRISDSLAKSNNNDNKVLRSFKRLMKETQNDSTTQSRSLFSLPMAGLDFFQKETVIRLPRIIGGEQVSLGEFPSFSFPVGDILCGGSLIHHDIILTAAQCSTSAYSNGVYVGGTQLNGSQSEFFRVEKSIAHPDYNSTSLSNDIMIVKLQRKSTAPLQELDYASSIPKINDPVTVIGFGLTQENGKNSDILLKVTVKASSNAACKAFWGTYFNPDIHLCAGIDDGSKDACNGDAGGPLLSSTGKQVGIVSSGTGCGRPNVPALYTRISAYEQWIQDTICTISDTPPIVCIGTREPTPVPPSISITFAPILLPVSCKSRKGKDKKGKGKVTDKGKSKKSIERCFDTSLSSSKGKMSRSRSSSPSSKGKDYSFLSSIFINDSVVSGALRKEEIMTTVQGSVTTEDSSKSSFESKKGKSKTSSLVRGHQKSLLSSVMINSVLSGADREVDTSNSITTGSGALVSETHVEATSTIQEAASAMNNNYGSNTRFSYEQKETSGHELIQRKPIMTHGNNIFSSSAVDNQLAAIQNTNGR